MLTYGEAVERIKRLVNMIFGRYSGAQFRYELEKISAYYELMKIYELYHCEKDHANDPREWSYGVWFRSIWPRMYPGWNRYDLRFAENKHYGLKHCKWILECGAFGHDDRGLVLTYTAKIFPR